MADEEFPHGYCIWTFDGTQWTPPAESEMFCNPGCSCAEPPEGKGDDPALQALFSAALERGEKQVKVGCEPDPVA